MAVLHDVLCEDCGHIWECFGTSGSCNQCGGHASWIPSKVNTPLDHYVYAPSVETEKKIKVSEARQLAKDNGLNIESRFMDKEHGSRNEEYKSLGTLYSGGGIRRRDGYKRGL